MHILWNGHTLYNNFGYLQSNKKISLIDINIDKIMMRGFVWLLEEDRRISEEASIKFETFGDFADKLIFKYPKTSLIVFPSYLKYEAEINAYPYLKDQGKLYVIIGSLFNEPPSKSTITRMMDILYVVRNYFRDHIFSSYTREIPDYAKHLPEYVHLDSSYMIARMINANPQNFIGKRIIDDLRVDPNHNSDDDDDDDDDDTINTSINTSLQYIVRESAQEFEKILYRFALCGYTDKYSFLCYFIITYVSRSSRGGLRFSTTFNIIGDIYSAYNRTALENINKAILVLVNKRLYSYASSKRVSAVLDQYGELTVQESNIREKTIHINEISPIFTICLFYGKKRKEYTKMFYVKLDFDKLIINKAEYNMVSVFLEFVGDVEEAYSYLRKCNSEHQQFILKKVLASSDKFIWCGPKSGLLILYIIFEVKDRNITQILLSNS